MLSSGVKDTDHGANSCQIAAPLGDYSRPFAKVRRQLRESGAHSLFCFGSFISLRSLSSISFFFFTFCFSPLFSCSLYRHTSGNTSLKLPERCLKPFVSCARQKADDGFQRFGVTPFHTEVYPWDLSEPTASNRTQGPSDKDHRDRDMPPKVIILRLCFCLTSGPRAGLTAHRLALIECDRFSH